MKTHSRHMCFVYEGDPSRQLPALAAMLQMKLNEGFRCMYLHNPSMVAGMRSTLTMFGIDVEREIAQNRLILSSDPVTSPDGSFDTDSMLRLLENTLDQALKDGFKGLWATGDMMWEFGSEKNLEKLLDYEHKLEEIFQRRSELCGICQYHYDTLPYQITEHGLSAHQAAFVNGTFSRVNPHFVPAGRSGNSVGV
ncbi:MAG TPA: MEDS domain-containing protein [Verrucomicrobiae bacterium]|jgi:hypothetical protein